MIYYSRPAAGATWIVEQLLTLPAYTMLKLMSSSRFRQSPLTDHFLQFIM